MGEKTGVPRAPGRGGAGVRVVACHEARLELADVTAPQPERGQVLLRVLRCGICGSDLHAREHCDELADVLSEIGYDDFMRRGDRVVFGHEFSGEVAEYGPGCRRRLATGTHVVALPLTRRAGEPHAIGLSSKAPGAYAEQVVVEESLMMAVPNGLSPDVSALTEPMAIGWHAVRRSEIGKKDVAIVIGCGPIGLAVICLLKARGVRTVIASDLSAGRRELASRCGADAVVDPARESPYKARGHGHITTLPHAVELAISTSEKLQRLPIPWQYTWRAIDAVGIAPKRPIVFECVGLPGVLDGVIATAPMFSRVIGVGVCMGEDRLRPSMAINKEIELRFVVGYTPLEFRDTLHMLADGKVDPAPLLTGVVGLEGVATAFELLESGKGGGSQAKILIDPARSEGEPVPPEQR
jgi:threonine dehydrogenase-like Zn-dependent dehydrogenase